MEPTGRVTAPLIAAIALFAPSSSCSNCGSETPSAQAARVRPQAGPPNWVDRGSQGSGDGHDKPGDPPRPITMNTQKATFAAGCFWGDEAAFRQVEGVVSTMVG